MEQIAVYPELKRLKAENDELKKKNEDLEERIAIMEDDGWHKITENADSYPKESKEIDVWICCEDENGNREVFKAVYYAKHFYDCAGWLYTENNGWKITHWKYRKFPEPPKGEET